MFQSATLAQPTLSIGGKRGHTKPANPRMPRIPHDAGHTLHGSKFFVTTKYPSTFFLHFFVSIFATPSERRIHSANCAMRPEEGAFTDQTNNAPTHP